MTAAVKPPTSFWIISSIALLWNLLGVFQFFAQAFMTEEAMALLPEEQQELYGNMPIWTLVVFAIGVFGGTFGAIGLLMRKKWAKAFFVLSFFGVILQTIYNFFISDGYEVLGTQLALSALFIIIIAVFLIWYSNKAIAKGWIY